MLDIRNPETVEIVVEAGKVWVNVDEICVLRIQEMKRIDVCLNDMEEYTPTNEEQKE